MTIKPAPPQSALLPALPLILATVSTILAVSRQLPLQNALATAVQVALLSGALMIVGANTGWPFGTFNFESNFGPRILSLLPWPIPCLWIVLVLNSRGTARLIFHRWPNLPNRGWWTIALAAFLAALLDINLDAFATRVNHYWIWKSPRMAGNHSAPVTNFITWLTSSFIILVTLVPWLVDKKPRPAPKPGTTPFTLWLLTDLALSCINAAHGLWAPAATGLLGGSVVVSLVLTSGSIRALACAGRRPLSRHSFPATADRRMEKSVRKPLNGE